jgi:3-oxoacyl-[acyl-carrier protein] reductase
VAVQADVASAGGAERLLARAEDAFGPVGVLVHNASGPVAAKPIALAAWGDVQEHLEVQLKGAFLVAKAGLPAMTSRRRGRIVFITSQVVDAPPTAGWAGYTIAKSAVASLARSLALECGPLGITVNCVAPGMTETAFIGGIPEKIQMSVARQTPLRRLAQPWDVAAAVAYLVAPEGAFITGQTLRVNGGMDMR